MFHRPRAATLFLATVLCASGWSSQGWSEPAGQPAQAAAGSSPVSPSPRASGLGLQRASLDNGLRVVLRVDHGLPQVAVCSTYDAGSRQDGRLSGRAALVHRMLREGGRSTSGADYSRQVEARGGKLGAELPQCRNLTPEATALGRERAAAARAEAAADAYGDISPIMLDMRKQGATLQEIADRLNRDGHTTRHGRPWNPVQVKRIIDRHTV